MLKQNVEILEYLFKFIFSKGIWHEESLRQKRAEEISKNADSVSSQSLKFIFLAFVPNTYHECVKITSKLILEKIELFKKHQKKKEKNLTCPISGMFIRDPVQLDENGIIFERSNLVEHIKKSNICPKTKVKLKNLSFSKVKLAQRLINEHIEEYSKHGVSFLELCSQFIEKFQISVLNISNFPQKINFAEDELGKSVEKIMEKCLEITNVLISYNYFKNQFPLLKLKEKFLFFCGNISELSRTRILMLDYISKSSLNSFIHSYLLTPGLVSSFKHKETLLIYIFNNSDDKITSLKSIFNHYKTNNTVGDHVNLFKTHKNLYKNDLNFRIGIISSLNQLYSSKEYINELCDIGNEVNKGKNNIKQIEKVIKLYEKVISKMKGYNVVMLGIMLDMYIRCDMNKKALETVKLIIKMTKNEEKLKFYIRKMLNLNVNKKIISNSLKSLFFDFSSNSKNESQREVNGDLNFEKVFLSFKVDKNNEKFKILKDFQFISLMKQVKNQRNHFRMVENEFSSVKSDFRELKRGFLTLKRSIMSGKSVLVKKNEQQRQLSIENDVKKMRKIERENEVKEKIREENEKKRRKMKENEELNKRKMRKEEEYKRTHEENQKRKEEEERNRRLDEKKRKVREENEKKRRERRENKVKEEKKSFFEDGNENFNLFDVESNNFDDWEKELEKTVSPKMRELEVSQDSLYEFLEKVKKHDSQLKSDINHVELTKKKYDFVEGDESEKKKGGPKKKIVDKSDVVELKLKNPCKSKSNEFRRISKRFEALECGWVVVLVVEIDSRVSCYLRMISTDEIDVKMSISINNQKTKTKFVRFSYSKGRNENGFYKSFKYNNEDQWSVSLELMKDDGKREEKGKEVVNKVPSTELYDVNDVRNDDIRKENGENQIVDHEDYFFKMEYEIFDD